MDNKFNKLINGWDDQEIEALQYAVLLGDNFSLDFLLDLVQINPSKLFDFIDKLISQDLIRIKSKGIKGTYIFTQDSFPEFVLNFLSPAKKKHYLNHIINYLDRIPAHDGKKASHLINLVLKYKNDLDENQHLKKAADFLTADQQTRKSLKLYREIIDRLLTRDLAPKETVLFLDAVIAYAPIAINIYPPQELLPIMNKALSLSVKLNNKRAEAMLELFAGRLYQRQGKSFEASLHCDKGWYLSQKIDDRNLRRFCSNLYALSLFWNGRIMQAIEVYEATLGNVDSISPALRDFWAYLVLALCYGISGRIGRGVGLAEAVLARAASKNNKKIIASAHAVIGVILLDIRSLQQAEVHLDKAIEIGESIKNDFVLYMAKQSKAYVEYKKGNLEKARSLIQAGFEHLEDTTAVHYPSPWFIELLFDFHQAGLDLAKGYSFTSEINRLLNWPDIYMKGTALRYYALSQNKEEGGENEKLLQDSCDLLQEAGAPIELGRTYIELSKTYLKKDDLTKAKKFAERAHSLFTDIDETLFPSQLSFLISYNFTDYKKYRGINELKTSISFLPDFKKYIGQVVTILADMFGAEHAAILLKQSEISTSFDVVATRNFTPEEIELFESAQLQSLFLKMVERGPIFLDDPKSKYVFQLSQHHLHIKSLILTPVIMRNNVIGLIYLDNRLLQGIFLKEDKILMKSISGQISMALRNQELYTEFSDPAFEPNERGQKKNKIEKQNAAFPNIIGRSKAIQEVLTNAEKTAGSESTVLIYGETGVGKELIAKAIHQASKRSGRPLIIVNLSALTSSLVESELFGHEKGAFTGAIASRPGRFETANGGTIFLDEIGDLSMDVQVKLLRVLQEGAFERVGSNKSIYSDFRVIAATNKDLHQMVEKGDFRSDLFYRINTFFIKIPPLRKRKEDIPSLALHFLNKYSQKYNKHIKRIDKNDMEKLLAYSWPGNVRELEHIIERAVIVSSNINNLIIPDLTIPFEEPSSVRNPDQDQLQSLESVQRNHIIRVLNHTRGKIRGEKGAAVILGLKPTTLEFRMKKLKLEKSDHRGRI